MGDTAVQQRAHGATTAVLVQGMHASGTSLLSCLVSLLMWERASEAAHTGDDPFPHLIQSGTIAGVNRRVLQELGSSWNRPGVLFLRGKGIAESAPAIREAIRAHYLHSAEGTLRSGSAGFGPIILEDPGICLLRDLWDAALRELGRSTRVVHVFRNPLEVAALLNKAHGLVQTRTLQLSVQYNLAALSTQGLGDPLVVPYTDLVNPDSSLNSRLAAYLDVLDPPRSEQDMHAEWKRLIEPVMHEASITDQFLVRSPLVPSIVKRLYSLLTEWETRNNEQRAAWLTDLAAAFEEQSLFAGNLIAVKLPEQSGPVAPFVSAGTSGTRKLLIHYHLFKNAGTSVDAILGRNFGDRWVNTEFPGRSEVDHQEAIRIFIRDNPHLAAISSHTLMLPAPQIDGVEIFPIVFVRHPLDRLKSAYEFERKQDAVTTGAQIAKVRDFAGYLRARLAIPGDRACRDFHVHRLAMAVPEIEGTEHEKALAAVERLPFVGLVEAFKASAELLQERARQFFPEFQIFESWENSSGPRQGTLEQRLEVIRDELGEECYSLIMEANEGDMKLHNLVRCHYPRHERGHTNCCTADAVGDKNHQLATSSVIDRGGEA